MPLHVPCAHRNLSPGLVIHPYWDHHRLYFPGMTTFLVTDTAVAQIPADLDTRADHTLFSSLASQRLGLTLPFPRQFPYSGAGGTQAGTLSFPPDGLISLFVTDYKEYCYLPCPLIGFHPPTGNPQSQRSVLGLTGFLQHFRFILDYEPARPCFELHPVPNFPGQSGILPRTGPLFDFIHSLRTAP